LAVGPDLDIRWRSGTGLLPMAFGIFAAGVAIVVFGQMLVTGTTALLPFGFASGFLCMGIWLFRTGINRFTDKNAKLSLTADGLKDHRTGEFVKWVDVRNVRLYVQTTNASLSSAKMYVAVSQGGSHREIEFDVIDLDRTHSEIAALVQKWSIAARSPEPPHPSAGL
jgi:hypothetical protein